MEANNTTGKFTWRFIALLVSDATRTARHGYKARNGDKTQAEWHCTRTGGPCAIELRRVAEQRGRWLP